MAIAQRRTPYQSGLGLFAKAKELKKRIVFTFLALCVFRLGTFIPLPGIDPTHFSKVFSEQSAGVLGLFNTFSGGAIERMAVFTLNIMPYISASIIIQLMSTMLPSLMLLKKEGDSGRRILNQYTRYLTVLIAVFQSFGIAFGLQHSGVVYEPGLLFMFSTVITLTGGTLLLMWIGEQITSNGIGNGTSLIIFTGIVTRLPLGVVNLLELSRVGTISSAVMLFVIVFVAVFLYFVVYVERTQRRIKINYPKRQVGNRVFEGQTSFLPLKVNTAGVIPPIFASSLLLLPATLAGLVGASGRLSFLQVILRYITHGGYLYMISYGSLIFFFTYFYTGLVFNPKETAEHLQKHSGFIPGVRPGDKTASYINTILMRITFFGACYLLIVCLAPELFASYTSANLAFGGTSILILVSVSLDFVTQVQSHLMAHQYEGLIKKHRLI